MKYAPILFPHPDDLKPEDFLKRAELVQSGTFYKSSIDGAQAPGPKPKGRIWELRSTTAGMVSGAAVMAIFILSGDPNMFAKASSVFTFFNNSLFPASSSIKGAMDPDGTAATATNDWESAFGHRFDMEKNLWDSTPVSKSGSTVMVQPTPMPVPTPTPAPVPAAVTPTPMPPTVPGPVPPSISAAMQDLNIGLGHPQAPPPPALPVMGPTPILTMFIPPQAPPAPPHVELDDGSMVGKVRPKPKPTKHKGKVVNLPEDEPPVEVDNTSGTITARKSRQNIMKY
ncbi:hypothetical protein PAXRUDRAFT_18805 [Paxillus rubicundulus Ve08.2h10]|uniref:Uncharacterized protein n=1 Tax=Paxillus rubicundulus Ve08.2h10 TaxID=930991 RepID=A0A0D0BWF6_9AGAM|nr:hypothetical protein PAXRUDRAFT_18805 [Paxillus rubicundulus Ve08.2h10]